MQKMPKSIFATVNPYFIPDIEISSENNRPLQPTISVKNGTKDINREYRIAAKLIGCRLLRS
jgi:hypothetical protein